MIELCRRWNNFKALPTKWAYRTLTRAMRRDPSYAHSWFCGISMSIHDSTRWQSREGWTCSHMSARQCNDIADYMMRHLFNVKNSSNPIGATNPKDSR